MANKLIMKIKWNHKKNLKEGGKRGGIKNRRYK